MTEDISAFFQSADFAVWATLGGQGVQGIFQDATAMATFGASQASALSITFVLPTTSVPAGVVGMSFSLNGHDLTVANHEQDGTGISTLTLERA